MSDGLKLHTTTLTNFNIDLETIIETLSYTTQNRRLVRGAAADIDIHGLKERNFRVGKETRVLLLSLVYILNGNHDPKKVQRLNLVLVSLFFALGLFFNQDLLPFGFAFSGIALINGVNVWIVQNLSKSIQNPVEREIAIQIHPSLQKQSGL